MTRFYFRVHHQALQLFSPRQSIYCWPNITYLYNIIVSHGGRFASSSAPVSQAEDHTAQQQLQRSRMGRKLDSDVQSFSHQRSWKASLVDDINDVSQSFHEKDIAATVTQAVSSVWTERIADRESSHISSLLQSISAQESQGGRLRSGQLGVLHEDPVTDMELLTQNYTVTALASALRDREDSLQLAARLAEEQRWEDLSHMLSIFHPKYILQRRSRKRVLNVTQTLDAHSLELIRKALMRMPRTVTQAHSRRAGVVIALCSVEGVPSLLLEKRSANIRAHPDEVCLPGGMVCSMNDRTIVATCLREMREEIDGINPKNTQVLGILRCNWGEVHHLVGVAVTPVVCCLGELPDVLTPCQREVAEVFTIPLASLLDKSLWIYKEGLAPMFLGGPHVIWGLTGYILDRFSKDILLPNSRSQDDDIE